ncbi:hypothetical protein NDU88_001076 [Pleurodeles waltl]|uniref:Uncharacterized protein n=1 Tax=Pleurodeles waltl TaxID=8319 RepID=A0AAV7KQI7_PLEWA|nr:hypothetical protein NDU88_001076 [Pleurodeles waltl]
MTALGGRKPNFMAKLSMAEGPGVSEGPAAPCEGLCGLIECPPKRVWRLGDCLHTDRVWRRANYTADCAPGVTGFSGPGLDLWCQGGGPPGLPSV